MDEGKKVSIIIPIYNRETLVSETLDSILSQSHAAWECIIVDDGSTDKTIEVLEKYQAKDQRIKVFQRPSYLPKGAPSCRNYGFGRATGDYIQYFDSDDLMLPAMLTDKVQYLNEHLEADFVVSKMGEFDEKGIKNTVDYQINSTNFKEDFLSYNVFFLTPGPLFRKSFLNKFNVKFDLRLTRRQEREFFTRIILTDPRFGTLETIHCLRRIHNESIKSIYSKVDIKQHLRSLFLYFYRLNRNSNGIYSSILYNAYGKIIFRLIFSFMKRGDFEYGFRCFSFYISLKF